MSTLVALGVGVLVVCGPAVLPVLSLLGRQWVALFLVPVVGAVLVGLAAVAAVALVLPLVVTWAALALVVDAAALLWWRRGARPWETVAVDRSTLAGAVLGTLVATAWAADRALSWDVHSFWYSRGRWFLVGSDYVVTQLTSPYTSPYPGPPHAQYPPVPSATPALMWELTGGVNYAAAKLLMAGVTASTLVLLAIGVARVVGTPRWLATLAALAVPSAGLYFATASSALGHVDLPYSAAGEAALIFGLLLPRRRPELAACIALTLLCGLLKNEGLVVAVLVAALVSLRHAGRDLGRLARLAVPWLALVGSWRAVVLLLGAGPAPPAGVTQRDELSAIRPLPSPGIPTILHLLAAHLWWLAVPLAVGSVALLLVTRRDRDTEAVRRYGAVLGYHAVVMVPLVVATALVLLGGDGLPWDKLVMRTARYFTFTRLALTVCLVALAADAARTVRRPQSRSGQPPVGTAAT